jgi:hypothetical protein
MPRWSVERVVTVRVGRKPPPQGPWSYARDLTSADRPPYLRHASAWFPKGADFEAATSTVTYGVDFTLPRSTN